MKKLLLGISSVVLINTSYANPSIVVLDSRDRVIFVQSDSCNMRFDYDECDNVICEHRGESSIEYKYSDSGELQKLGNEEFKYDSLGRLTYKSGNSIQYNEYNMMSNFNAFKYFYDTKSGLRSSKEVNGASISFVLDDFGRVIEEKNESNDVISSIEWNGDLPYIYHYGGKVYRYLCNAHGDVVALVDEDGVEVNSYSYDVFGKLISEEETIPNAIRYRHEYYDAESGMYYLRGRYYVGLLHLILQRTE